MKTRVVMCQNTFIPDIIALVKQTTLRCKARCKPGDVLVFRKWIGKPRQKGSKQVTFGTAKCLAVTKVEIYPEMLKFYGDLGGWHIYRSFGQLILVARKDGFKSWNDLIAWFRKNHPGKDAWAMDMIYWGNTFVPEKEEKP